MSNPTELPDLDRLEALAKQAGLNGWPFHGVAFQKAANPAAVLALIALARRPPVPAPRPTDDELWDSTIRDRDTYHEWADKLADAIASYFGVDIGEHSNQNCPWHEALEAIESADPDRRAQPEGEAPQADEVAEDEVVGYALRHKETGKYGSWLYPHEHRAMLAKQRDSNYSGPYPLYARQSAAQHADSGEKDEILRLQRLLAYKDGQIAALTAKAAQQGAAPCLTDADENAPWLTLAHIVCQDAGIEPGHITKRLEALRTKLESAPGTPEAPAEKHLPGWERGIATVTLSGHQLREALDFINPDGDDDPDQRDDWLTFGIVQHKDDDGNATTGLCCWNDDSEGVLPMDESPRAAQLDGGQGEGNG